jgi:hypothetical protein
LSAQEAVPRLKSAHEAAAEELESHEADAQLASAHEASAQDAESQEAESHEAESHDALAHDAVAFAVDAQLAASNRGAPVTGSLTRNFRRARLAAGGFMA